MEEIRCNKCGKLIMDRNHALADRTNTGSITKEPADYLKITKEWGYFSKKDLEIHEFNLCEDCYDAWIQSFQIPVRVRENREVLGI